MISESESGFQWIEAELCSNKRLGAITGPMFSFEVWKTHISVIIMKVITANFEFQSSQGNY